VVVGGGLSLTATIMAAYTLSKQYLPYRKILTYFVYIPMKIGGGLIPTFLVVKFIGLYGSLWACVIPGMVGSWNVFLMRNFFREIPESLEEAALLDGANDVQILVKVILPVSLPAIP
jgi:putative aldouronate transport system permease protein